MHTCPISSLTTQVHGGSGGGGGGSNITVYSGGSVGSVIFI